MGQKACSDILPRFRAISCTATTGYNRKYAMGSSTMPRRCNTHLSAPARAITGQKSNTCCSWPGTQPTGSAPNDSSPFFLPC